MAISLGLSAPHTEWKSDALHHVASAPGRVAPASFGRSLSRRPTDALAQEYATHQKTRGSAAEKKPSFRSRKGTLLRYHCPGSLPPYARHRENMWGRKASEKSPEEPDISASSATCHAKKQKDIESSSKQIIKIALKSSLKSG